MFFEAFSSEIVYDSNMLEHQTNPHFNAYEKHIIVVILFVSALLGLGSEADEYKTEQNIAYKVLNNKGLRYNNEFVMHKILDCLGDLVLSDYKILGKITCSQGGHKLTNEFLRKFFSDKSNYSIVEFNEKKLPNTVLYNKGLAATA